MPQRLVVHLGLHKTATTSLQEFLAANARPLLAGGASYPKLNRMRSDLTPLICSMAKGDRAALQRFVDKVRQPVLLLSDENILGAPGDILGGALYPFAENRIRKLCDQFDRLPIALFVTLRAPAAFLGSMYCEYLRHNPYLRFEDYVLGFDLRGFSYAEVFDWMFALPRHVRVTALPFETTHGGGVRRIADAIVTAACGAGHPIDLDAFPEAKSRASFSREELDLATIIAERADARTAQIFLNMLDGRDRRFGVTRFAPLPPEVVAALDARYIQDLAAFARLRA